MTIPIVKWRQVSLWKKVIRLKHGHGLFQSSGTPRGVKHTHVTSTVYQYPTYGHLEVTPIYPIF